MASNHKERPSFTQLCLCLANLAKWKPDCEYERYQFQNIKQTKEVEPVTQKNKQPTPAEEAEELCSKAGACLVKDNVIITIEGPGMLHVAKHLAFNSNVKGATLYLSHPPCTKCSLLLLQQKISSIVCIANYSSNDKETNYLFKSQLVKRCTADKAQLCWLVMERIIEILLLECSITSWCMSCAILLSTRAEYTLKEKDPAFVGAVRVLMNKTEIYQLTTRINYYDCLLHFNFFQHTNASDNWNQFEELKRIDGMYRYISRFEVVGVGYSGKSSNTFAFDAANLHNSIHAEEGAMLTTPKTSIPNDKEEVFFVTLQPCSNCTMALYARNFEFGGVRTIFAITGSRTTDGNFRKRQTQLMQILAGAVIEAIRGFHFFACKSNQLATADSIDEWFRYDFSLCNSAQEFFINAAVNADLFQNPTKKASLLLLASIWANTHRNQILEPSRHVCNAHLQKEIIGSLKILRFEKFVAVPPSHWHLNIIFGQQVTLLQQFPNSTLKEYISAQVERLALLFLTGNPKFMINMQKKKYAIYERVLLLASLNEEEVWEEIKKMQLNLPKKKPILCKSVDDIKNCLQSNHDLIKVTKYPDGIDELSKTQKCIFNEKTEGKYQANLIKQFATPTKESEFFQLVHFLLTWNFDVSKLENKFVDLLFAANAPWSQEYILFLNYLMNKHLFILQLTKDQLNKLKTKLPQIHDNFAMFKLRNVKQGSRNQRKVLSTKMACARELFKVLTTKPSTTATNYLLEAICAIDYPKFEIKEYLQELRRYGSRTPKWVGAKLSYFTYQTFSAVTYKRKQLTLSDSEVTYSMFTSKANDNADNSNTHEKESNPSQLKNGAKEKDCYVESIQQQENCNVTSTGSQVNHERDLLENCPETELDNNGYNEEKKHISSPSICNEKLLVEKKVIETTSAKLHAESTNTTIQEQETENHSFNSEKDKEVTKEEKKYSEDKKFEIYRATFEEQYTIKLLDKRFERCTRCNKKLRVNSIVAYKESAQSSYMCKFCAYLTHYLEFTTSHNA